jgi:hypothetical protein
MELFGSDTIKQDRSTILWHVCLKPESFTHTTVEELLGVVSSNGPQQNGRQERLRDNKGVLIIRAQNLVMCCDNKDNNPRVI